MNQENDSQDGVFPARSSQESVTQEPAPQQDTSKEDFSEEALSPEASVQTPIENLRLGPGTPVLVTTSGFSEQLKCLLVGLQEGKYLILRLPLMAGLDSQIPEGELITMRYLSQGMVFGFRSNIMGKYARGPLRFLFTSYPSQVESHNLRKAQRVPCYVPATLQLGKISLEGVILDVSTGGIRFHYVMGPDVKLPGIAVGQELTIKSALLGKEGVFDLPCRVANLIQDRDRLTMGMCFTREKGEPLDTIHSYVAKVLELIEDVMF